MPEISKFSSNSLIITMIVNIIVICIFIFGAMRWIADTTYSIQRLTESQVNLAQTVSTLADRVARDEEKILLIEKRHVAEDVTGRVNKPIH